MFYVLCLLNIFIYLENIICPKWNLIGPIQSERLELLGAQRRSRNGYCVQISLYVLIRKKYSWNLEPLRKSLMWHSMVRWTISMPKNSRFMLSALATGTVQSQTCLWLVVFMAMRPVVSKGLSYSCRPRWSTTPNTSISSLRLASAHGAMRGSRGGMAKH